MYQKIYGRTGACFYCPKEKNLLEWEWHFWHTDNAVLCHVLRADNFMLHIQLLDVIKKWSYPRAKQLEVSLVILPVEVQM